MQIFETVCETEHELRFKPLKRVGKETVVSCVATLLENGLPRPMPDEIPDIRGIWLPKPKNVDKYYVALVNKYYEMAVVHFIQNFDYWCIIFSEAESEAKFREAVQWLGPVSYTYLMIETAACRILAGDMKIRTDGEELSAIIVVMKMLDDLIWKNKDPIGRIVFDRNDQQGWRFARKATLNGFDYNDILDAHRMGGFRELDQKKLDRLYLLHRKYGFVMDWSYGEYNFSIHGSPFAEKQVGDPIGNFDIVIYPRPAGVNSWMKDELETVKDPTFEHADGSFAFASLTITKSGSIIIQEIQTDVENLFKRSKKEPSESMKVALHEWPKIVLRAVLDFASKMGHREIYAATPYSAFGRYHGNMHPDKARIYFEGLERLGSQMVLDDSCKLSSHQGYWYMFRVPDNIREPTQQ